MSYELTLRFTSPVRASQLAEYFKARSWYSAEAGIIEYGNLDTGVHFALHARGRWGLSRDRLVRELHFEINYGRPSYFAVEADIELRALVDAFNLRIEDPQMHGMGDGPYTTEGFLRAWTFGNAFLVSTVLRHGTIGDYRPAPREVLREAWEWNYRRRDRMARLGDIQFFPQITYWQIDGRICRAVIWAEGMPIMLPKVDRVFIGRWVNGERRAGLVAWEEVERVVAGAGIDTSKSPLDVYYKATPEPIARWIADVPLVELESLTGLEPERLLDEDCIADAQAILAGNARVSTASLEGG